MFFGSGICRSQRTFLYPFVDAEYPCLFPPELHMFVVFGEVFGVFRLLEGFWLVFLGH